MSRILLRIALIVALTSTFLVVGPAKPAAAAGPAWWNASYSDRLAINVRANDAISSGYSLDVVINHARMVSQGMSLANGDDVRIAYWNGTSWAELDRVLAYGSSWNNAATDLVFKTQAAVSANTDDTGYYLYYGNGSAVTPLANANNVYTLWDDFSSGTLDAAKWTTYTPGTGVAINVVGGEAQIAGTTNSSNAYNEMSLQTLNYFNGGYRVDSTYRVASQSIASNWKGSTGHKFDTIGVNGSPSDRRTSYYDGVNTPQIGLSTMTGQTPGPTRVSETMNLSNTVKRYEGGVIMGARYDAPSSSFNRRSWMFSPNASGVTFDVRIDDVVIRKFVTNEPTVTVEGANDIAFSTSVAPVFSLSLGTHSGSCNAATQSAGVTTTGSSIALGRINSSAPVVGIQDIAAVSNARVGFVVKVTSSAPLTAGSNTIPDLTSTNASPAAFAAGAGFGYSTTGDSRWAPDKWSGLTRSDDLILAGFNPGTWNTCIAYKAQVAANTPAASYSTTLTYKAIPVF